MKRIQTEKEYEENHKRFKEIDDKALYDYFLAISDIYEQVSTEVAYRLLRKEKVVNHESKN